MTRDPKAREDHLLRMFEYWRGRALKAERGSLPVRASEERWLLIDDDTPKDRPILVCTDEGGVGEAHYQEDAGWYWANCHSTDVTDGEVRGAKWWMPLPLPPLASGGG